MSADKGNGWAVDIFWRDLSLIMEVATRTKIYKNGVVMPFF